MKTKIDSFPLASIAKAIDWLANRGGVAVWTNKDLGSSSVGAETYTPAMTDGKPTPAPHWQFGSAPAFVVTEAENICVQSWKEVARVKIRRGPPCYGGVNRADRPKLDVAMAKAGTEATWTPDYSGMDYGSAWFVAVISVPDVTKPLTEFLPVPA